MQMLEEELAAELWAELMATSDLRASQQNACLAWRASQRMAGVSLIAITATVHSSHLMNASLTAAWRTALQASGRHANSDAKRHPGSHVSRSLHLFLRCIQISRTQQLVQLQAIAQCCGLHMHDQSSSTGQHQLLDLPGWQVCFADMT